MSDGGEHGYTTRAYIDTLSEFGAPVRLRRSAGWVLQRPIPRTQQTDLAGAYPLFSCTDWSRVLADLADLPGQPVTAVVVADPLARPPIDDLRTAFTVVAPFKEHLIRDLGCEAPLPAHHRRRLRHARERVEVEVVGDPIEHHADWTRLYAGIRARAPASSFGALSDDALGRQLVLPDMTVVRAIRSGATVSMALWMVDGENAYFHLGASSDEGYAVSASYAVFASALEELARRGVRRVDLGGAAGDADAVSGLHRFKAGWATARSTAYLCGRVLDDGAYEALVAALPHPTGWFPAYRAPSSSLAEFDEQRTQ